MSDDQDHIAEFDPDDWSLDEPYKPWRGILTALPAVGAGLVPVSTCLGCLAATAGVLSAFGLGFLVETAYLLPLIVVFLGAVLWALAHKARALRGFGPFFVGVVSAAAILTGKFAFSLNVVLYVGLAGLSGAAVWDAWPPGRRPRDICSDCNAVE